MQHPVKFLDKQSKKEHFNFMNFIAFSKNTRKISSIYAELNRLEGLINKHQQIVVKNLKRNILLKIIELLPFRNCYINQHTILQIERIIIACLNNAL